MQQNTAQIRLEEVLPIIQNLISRVEQLEEEKSICCSFTTNNQVQFFNARVCWDVDNVSSPFLVKQNADSEVRVLKSGNYFVVVQILNIAGQNVFPVLFVNNAPVQYGYGTAPNYTKGTIALAISLNVGDVVSVGFQQNATGNVYPRYHTFSLFRIK